MVKVLYAEGSGMKILETKLVDILQDLKENYCVNSVKAEFAAERTTFKEITFLKEITLRSGLDLTLKIGGCEAVKDLYDAKTVEADAIVVPMIETPYALKKFINAINCVYKEENLERVKTYINIETITGFKMFDDILKSEEFNELDGIILGRSDLVNSMDLKSDVNSEKVLHIAKTISEKMVNTGKKMIIGGGVSADNSAFFEKIPYLSEIETRKIVFDAKNLLNNNNFSEGIARALEFEIMWLNNKENFGGIFTDRDKTRISILKSRYKDVELSELNE